MNVIKNNIGYLLFGDVIKLQEDSGKSYAQAKEMYEAALQKAPSDQGSREGLTAVQTVSTNLEAGKTSLRSSQKQFAYSLTYSTKASYTLKQLLMWFDL